MSPETTKNPNSPPEKISGKKFPNWKFGVALVTALVCFEVATNHSDTGQSISMASFAFIHKNLPNLAARPTEIVILDISQLLPIFPEDSRKAFTEREALIALID